MMWPSSSPLLPRTQTLWSLPLRTSAVYGVTTPQGRTGVNFQRRGAWTLIKHKPPCTPSQRAVFSLFSPFHFVPSCPYLFPFLCWITKSLLEPLWAAHYLLLMSFLYPAICSSWLGLGLGLADPESQPRTWNPAPLACSPSGLTITPFPSWP